MAGRVISVVRRVSSSQSSTMHYRSRHIIRKMESKYGLELTPALSAEVAYGVAYEDLRVQLMDRLEELDCKMQRLKVGIDEDFAGTDNLAESRDLGKLLHEWEKNRSVLNRMYVGFDEGFTGVEKSSTKNVIMVPRYAIKRMMQISTLGVLLGSLYMAGRHLKGRDDVST